MLDFFPLIRIRGVIRIVRRELWNFFIFNLLRKNKVKDHVDEGSECKTGLHNQFNGVIEAEKGAVGACVCEDVGEPAEGY
jgi:hypothetical protein